MSEKVGIFQSLYLKRGNITMTCYNCRYFIIKGNNHYECAWKVATIINPWEICDEEDSIVIDE